MPHKAWYVPSVPIPKALEGKVISILKDRIKRKTLEPSHSAYRNHWFLVQKKDGGLRLINNAVKINVVTLRDVGLSPIADNVSEEFAMDKMLSLADLFSRYDQIALA